MKLIVLFLSSLFFFLFAISPVSAKINPHTVPDTNPDVPKNLNTFTQSVMIEVMGSLSCQLAGVNPASPNQACLGVDQKTGKIGFVENGGGAVGVMGNMIATLYTPPFHASDYFRNLASNFGISKKAYAQNIGGTGFQGLTPLLGIWTTFRNIVYLILTIVFIVIGFAIMFRIKIDPRTVMSIQNQIPKIIIGILVVTFSFAIAGFLIDLMWVSIYLIYGIFSGIPGASGAPIDVQALNPIIMQGKNALGAAGGIGKIGEIALNSSTSISSIIVQEFLSGPVGKILAFAIGSGLGLLGSNALQHNAAVAGGGIVGAGLCAVTGVGAAITPLCAFAGAAIGKLVISVVGGLAAATFSDQLLGVIAGIITFVIVSIALLFALVRLWFTLIMAYVHILIDVVLAPFWIIGGIVPGSPISLSGWLRDLIANLAAFPAVIGMFLLGKVFMDSFGKPPASGQNFVPPLIGNPGDPSLIGSLIGLGIILMTPNVVNMLKAALKAPKIDTGGIGKAIGVGVGAPKSAVGSMFEYQRKVPEIGSRGGFGALFGRMFGR